MSDQRGILEKTKDAAVAAVETVVETVLETTTNVADAVVEKLEDVKILSPKKMTGKERRESTSSGTSSDSDASSTKDEETKPSDDTVLNKYTSAGEVANTVLKELIAKVKEGAVVGELCDYGDKRINELTANLFKKDLKMLKGIAMPTCVSVDNIVCHFSPLKSDPAVTLKKDQVVKIDVGAHVDGFVGLAAHTVVVGADKDNKVKDKKAAVILAAYNCLEATLRMIHPSRDKDSLQITDAIAKITKSFGVSAVENMVSYEVSKYKVTGEKQIVQNPADDQKSKMEKFKFENYEVFAIDVLVTTGDGKVKPSDHRTTVFKKADELVYSLKMKASRQFLSEVTKRFSNLPFSLRMFENENAAKMGSLECANHGLIAPYNVLIDKDAEVVAHFKATAVILPNGIIKIAGLPLEDQLYETSLRIEDEQLAALVKEQLKPKKKAKAAKKTEDASETKKADSDKKTPTETAKPDAASKNSKESPKKGADSAKKSAAKSPKKP